MDTQTLITILENMPTPKPCSNSLLWLRTLNPNTPVDILPAMGGYNPEWLVWLVCRIGHVTPWLMITREAFNAQHQLPQGTTTEEAIQTLEDGGCFKAAAQAERRQRLAEEDTRRPYISTLDALTLDAHGFHTWATYQIPTIANILTSQVY